MAGIPTFPLMNVGDVFYANYSKKKVFALKKGKQLEN
jgi:hypothetical protein